MSFSKHLRNLADPIFESIKCHPFVLGIGDESLRPEQLIHYVRQDFQYLNTYVKIYGLALAKCETREEMRDLHTRIGFVLNDEVHPHVNFCRAASVDYCALQKTVELAPAAHHYAGHMLSIAQTGSLGEILATLLPCHWTYVEIAEELQRRHSPTEAHLFYDWITFYTSDVMKTGLTQLTSWLDRYAESTGRRERDTMTNAFLESCQLERRFFEMAYRVETW